MKGPYERLKYDLRRLWECPVCLRRERAPGAVASKLCLCQMQKPDGKPVVMKLIEDGVQRTVPPVVLEHEPLPPLPPIVLPPDEPREVAAVADVRGAQEIPLTPDSSPTRGEGRKADPSSPAPLPQRERGAGLASDPSPSAPLPEAERGE